MFWYTYVDFELMYGVVKWWNWLYLSFLCSCFVFGGSDKQLGKVNTIYLKKYVF
jgi:hypothetical protein